ERPALPATRLDFSVPELDLVVAAIDQPLHDLTAGARPAQQLRRHLIVLFLIEHLQQRAAVEGAGADIESERDQSVELILIERHFDAGVDGRRRRLDILPEKVRDLLFGQAVGISYGHALDRDLARRQFAFGEQVADADRRQPGRIFVYLQLE